MTAALLLTPLLAVAMAGDGAPEVVHVGAVAPDVIGIAVQAGRVEHGRQAPYVPAPGDRVDRRGKDRWVRRDGKPIGALAGKDGDVLCTLDHLAGEPLNVAWAERAASYRVRSPDDAAFADGVRPVAVHRKSKPTDVARVTEWQFEAPLRHVLYLKLPRPLAEGKRYVVEFAGGPLQRQEFVFDTARLRSEAVHVSHLGFRPDDPGKVAFLSCWMGSGGPLSYREGLRFEVVDAGTGTVVHSGRARLARRAGEPEDAYGTDHTGADVHEMDFTPLDRPGTYRLRVEGIGCSYPFEVADDVWRQAFTVSARGFYHQRSGIELGPPYTDFVRPRTFHPDDGLVVYHSTCPLMDSGNGLNARGTDKDNFGNLVAGKTDRVVPDAWGGYMDAGDWDRRIQHLIVSRYLMELAELFPGYLAGLSLNIPESPTPLPDVVDEALFNLDCYRRMQTPEGGIRGGIESAEHPRHGEASWQESLDVMAYAPGVWSSYVYAGTAGQAARVLESLGDEQRAAVYRDSALRAMQWAEQHLDPAADYPHAVRDERNLAAAELWRLTGDARWHQVFLQTTVFHDAAAQLFVWQKHEQREAAWVYARTDRPGADEAVRRNCRAAILREAGERARRTTETGFRWSTYEWRPPVWGSFSAPDGVSLVRAHVLTGDRSYLRALVLACQASAGANPVNLCYTTGLGHDWPRHPLHLDSRITHQPAPPGITVGGPKDPRHDPGYFGQKIVAPFCHPAVETWPTLEAYFDVFWSPLTCEFTVQDPMARNAYVWGYLAARP